MMKILTRILLGLCIVIIVLVAAVFGLLGTRPGLDLVASVVNSVASNDDQTIEITGIDGVLSGRPSVQKVTIADREGVWLTVADVQAELALLPLLTVNIQAAGLSADMIDLARLPQGNPEAEPAPSDGGGFSLPAIRADIQNIFVREIRLGEPVIGEAATLQLTGAAMLDDAPVNIAGNLELLRTDGAQGDIKADWKLAPDTNELKLDLSVSEPRDGLLARTLDIYGLPSVDARIKGDGPLDNWQSQISVSLDGEETVSGSVALSWTQERQQVSGALAGQLARLAPQQFKPVLAGETDIKVDVTRASDNTLRIDTLSVKSQLASLSAAGHVLPDSNAVDMQASLEFGMPGSDVMIQLDDNASVTVGHVQMTTALKGSMDDAQWRLEAAVASLSDDARSLTDLRITGSSPDINVNARSGSAVVKLDIGSLNSGQADVADLVDGPASMTLQANLNGDRLDLQDIQFALNQIRGALKGDVDLADLTLSLALRANVPAQKKGLARQLFGDQALDISGNLARNGEGLLSFSNLDVKSGNLMLGGKGQLSSSALEFDGDVALQDLSALNADVAGSVQADVRLSGSPEDPSFEITARGRDVVVLENALENLVLTAQGRNAVSDLAADIKLDGRYNEQPLSIVADVSRGSGPIPLISNLKVDIPGVTASGGLQPNADGVVTGELDVDVTSLEELAPLLLRDDLAGKLTGKAVFADNDSRQTVNAKFSTDRLDAAGVVVQSMTADLNVSVLPDGLGLLADVRAGQIDAQGQKITDAVIKASGDLDKMPLSISANVADSPVRVSGWVSMVDNVTTIALDEAKGTYSNIPLNLTQPIEIRITGETTQLPDIALQIGQGTATISGSAGDQLAVDVKIERLPLSIIDNVAATGMGPQGTLSATAKITGASSDPTVDYQVNVESLSTEITRSIQAPALSIDSSGTFAGMVLNTTSRAFGGGLELNANGSLNLSGDSPQLDISLQGAAPFAFAGLALASSGVQLNGVANVSLSVSGSAANPNLSGQISTSGATFIEDTAQLVIRDIATTIDFTAARATISSLSGRLGQNGKISGSGYVDLDAGAGFPADIQVSLDDGVYSDGEIVTAEFDAKMHINGPVATTGALDGTVDIRRMDITVPDTLPSSIPLVDVKHINPPAAVARQTQEITGGGSSSSSSDDTGGLQLDLTVNAPGRIFLRGRGMDAEFRGNIEVVGSVGNPRATGDFEMVRGRINVLTKRFVFDHGKIIFTGPLDPTLDFETATTQGGVTFSVNVDGTASSPQITFSSSPEMPQDEVLAQLFFGKGVSNLSAIQLAQLAGAIAEISGTGGGGGLFGSLRNFTGLDDIDIQSGGDDGETTVGIGRYLNDRTYLNVEKGLTGDSGRVRIDVELTDHLKLRGEAGIDGNTKAGIFYERDYK